MIFRLQCYLDERKNKSKRSDYEEIFMDQIPKMGYLGFSIYRETMNNVATRGSCNCEIRIIQYE